MSVLISKEDALNCFHDWIDRYGYEHTADEDPVYQRIAELKSIEDCDDAISRRMAIEVIDEWFKKVVRRNMSAYEYDSAYAQGEIDAYVTAINTLKTLPAVQPDHNADVSKKVTDEDCISRRVAIELCDWYDNPSLHDDLEKLPPAQPETHWIPCGERMPDEHEWIGTKKFGTTMSDEVYVTFENSKGERFTKHLHFHNGELSSYDKTHMDVWFKDYKPIAWMPLPEPYRGGGKK